MIYLELIKAMQDSSGKVFSKKDPSSVHFCSSISRTSSLRDCLWIFLLNTVMSEMELKTPHSPNDALMTQFATITPGIVQSQSAGRFLPVPTLCHPGARQPGLRLAPNLVTTRGELDTARLGFSPGGCLSGQSLQQGSNKGSYFRLKVSKTEDWNLAVHTLGLHQGSFSRLFLRESLSL